MGFSEKLVRYDTAALTIEAPSAITAPHLGFLWARHPAEHGAFPCKIPLSRAKPPKQDWGEILPNLAAAC
jgi:hypothetical protein